MKANTKTALGVVLIVMGGILGLYIGLWWGMVGGICGAIEAYKNDVDSMGIAVNANAVRFMLAGTFGWIAARICWASAFVMVAASDDE